MTKKKTDTLKVVLILAIIGAFIYVQQGGQTPSLPVFPSSDTTTLSTVIELNKDVTPIFGSPLQDLDVKFSAVAYQDYVPEIDYQRQYSIAESSQDEIADAGAQVEFTLTITVTNESGQTVFQKTFSYTKGSDRTFTIYGNASDIQLYRSMAIKTEQYIKITLPTEAAIQHAPDGTPIPTVIERTTQNTAQITTTPNRRQPEDLDET